VTADANATGEAARSVKSAAEALGKQSERLRGQVDDFLAKIRSAQRRCSGGETRRSAGNCGAPLIFRDDR
jgi:hypothetical protein